MKEEKNEEKKAATVASGIAGGATGAVTGAKTQAFNHECQEYVKSLGDTAQCNQAVLQKKLASDPAYVGDRGKGVANAYGYEKADVAMGGSGSAEWNKQERQELLQTGHVRGAEGHHINNVADHPEQQTDPDNIRFYRTRKEHLADGHNGDFKNASHGKLVDKEAMLKRTNRERVIKNEVTGAGIAAATGAVAGVVSSVLETCKSEGWSFKSVQKGVKKSGKPALYSASVALGAHLASRFLSNLYK